MNNAWGHSVTHWVKEKSANPCKHCRCRSKEDNQGTSQLFQMTAFDSFLFPDANPLSGKASNKVDYKHFWDYLFLDLGIPHQPWEQPSWVLIKTRSVERWWRSDLITTYSCKSVQVRGTSGLRGFEFLSRLGQKESFLWANVAWHRKKRLQGRLGQILIEEVSRN